MLFIGKPIGISLMISNSISNTMKIEASIAYQVVENSKFYFQCVHHCLTSGKRFEQHCHRSKLNFWYWQNEYTTDTSKVSGFWMSFVSGTHLYRQKTKYTKPAANPVLTTRVLGLPIRECAGSCNSSVQMCTTVNAINVTTKAIFEHWNLVPGWGTLGSSVNCPCASTLEIRTGFPPVFFLCQEHVTMS